MTASEASSGGSLQPVKFSRLARRALLLGLTGSQAAAIGAGLVPLVVALYLGDGVLAALPVAAVAAAVGLVPVAGRTLVDWLPIGAVWAWRSATRQREFRARLDRPRPAGTLALPGRAAALRQYIDPITDAALVHDPHAATLTVVVPVEHPAFVLLDPDDQQRRADGWGRALASVCRSGRIAALTVTERTQPASGASLTDWWRQHGHGDGTWAARIYGELVDRAGPTGERHTTTVSLTLDLRAAARPVRAAGGGIRGAAAVLRQETTALVTALRAADLTPGAPMDAGDLAVMLRTAYDPVAAPALERHPDLGRDLASAGPVAVAESWDHLRSDGAWHCVLWISQWPQSPVYPGFLAPVLLTSGVQRTFSVTFTPVRSDVAARDLRRKKTGHITNAAQRARLGQTDDVRESIEHGDVLAQEADLAAGHGVLRAAGLITVSAADPDDLERQVATIEQVAAQAGCETRRLWGQQAVGFSAAQGIASGT